MPVLEEEAVNTPLGEQDQESGQVDYLELLNHQNPQNQVPLQTQGILIQDPSYSSFHIP